LWLGYVLAGAVIWIRIVPTLPPSKPIGAQRQRRALGEALRITFVYGQSDPVVRTARLFLWVTTIALVASSALRLVLD
jgi:hypothetical protein